MKIIWIVLVILVIAILIGLGMWWWKTKKEGLEWQSGNVTYDATIYFYQGTPSEGRIDKIGDFLMNTIHKLAKNIHMSKREKDVWVFYVKGPIDTEMNDILTKRDSHMYFKEVKKHGWFEYEPQHI